MSYSTIFQIDEETTGDNDFIGSFFLTADFITFKFLLHFSEDSHNLFTNFFKLYTDGVNCSCDFHTVNGNVTIQMKDNYVTFEAVSYGGNTMADSQFTILKNKSMDDTFKFINDKAIDFYKNCDI